MNMSIPYAFHREIQMINDQNHDYVRGVHLIAGYERWRW